MGNSATKEQRPPQPRLRSSQIRPSSSPPAPSPTFSTQTPGEQPLPLVYSSRHGRGSRSELTSLLGLGNATDRESAGPEGRRETKQEREARKLEKERILREKERERSMREESVDGGYLVTQGVYTGTEDYSKIVVRQLMIERRVAPFWKGLNDHSESWTENQLVAAARGLPVPAPDEVPSEDYLRPMPRTDSQLRISEQNLHSLTVPISSRSQSYNSDTSSFTSPTFPTSSVPSTSSTLAPPSSSSALFRGRAKTLASLTTSSKNNSQSDMSPREINLPREPFVNGQPTEAYLYKDALECPICFLYYPPYLNKTRCCDQAICSECFVQIKRADPHPPEHADPSAPPPEPCENPDPIELDGDGALVSEPAACPFCKQPEFGITYDPPPFRRGLTYVNHASTHPFANAASAMSSSSSLGSYSGSGGQLSPTTATRRRTTSISASSPIVITTDRVRPDWATKLSTARAHAARRSAAATALHTAAYLMGNRNQSSDARNLGAFGRRGMLRRGTGADSPSGGTSSTQLNMLALMSERYAASAGSRADMGAYSEGPPTMMAPPRGSSRRNRMEDLEDMMMMEAIRLSLASEEERRKREEKEAKKEAKKKEKESKKAEKVARKAGVYQGSPSHSSPTLDTFHSGAKPVRETLPADSAKGKTVQRGGAGSIPGRSSDSALSSPLLHSNVAYETNNDDAQNHLERSRAQLQPDALLSSLPYGASPYKPSHLRNLSNASSSASSVEESVPGSLKYGGSHSSFEHSPNISGINIPARGEAVRDTFSSATPPGGGAGVEPMFNFRSLAAMIGHDEKADLVDYSDHVEDIGDVNGQGHQRGESSSSVVVDGGRKDSVVTLGQSMATLKPDEQCEDVLAGVDTAVDVTEVPMDSRASAISESDKIVGESTVRVMDHNETRHAISSGTP